MMKFPLIITFIFSLMSAVVSAQGNYSDMIKGEWVVMESLPTTEIESPQISSYFKYEFMGNGAVFCSTNEFERGILGEYSISGDTLKLMGSRYIIQSFENDRLEIEARLKFMNDKPWFRSTLVRKSTFDSVWEHVTERGKFIDSAPVFKGKSYLYEQVFPNPAALHDPSSYAVSEMQNATNRFQQKEDITIRVNLIVDSVGAVSIKNIVHSQSENEKKTNEIRQRLVSTSGQWAPAILNGKPISQELQLTFVNRGKVWLKLKERAIQKFERAKLHMQKQHYEAAIMFASEAISLDKNRFQFYVIRAACTIKLGDIDKYCKDVAKANALNPFVSLTNVEIVNGEPVEIKCGGR